MQIILNIYLTKDPGSWVQYIISDGYETLKCRVPFPCILPVTTKRFKSERSLKETQSLSEIFPSLVTKNNNVQG